MAAVLSTWNTEENEMLKLWGFYSFDSPCQRELKLACFKVDFIKLKYLILF